MIFDLEGHQDTPNKSRKYKSLLNEICLETSKMEIENVEIDEKMGPEKMKFRPMFLNILSIESTSIKKHEMGSW